MDQTLYTLWMQEIRFLLGSEAEQSARTREIAQNIANDTLRAIVMEHAEETDAQTQRLQDILSAAGEELEGEVASAVEGLLEDAEMLADLELGENAQDTALAAAARKTEHYEMGCYEAAIAMAEQLGFEDAVHSLRQSLDEERRADQLIAAAMVRLIQSRVPVDEVAL